VASWAVCPSQVPWRLSTRALSSVCFGGFVSVRGESLAFGGFQSGVLEPRAPGTPASWPVNQSRRSCCLIKEVDKLLDER
jgi:hypothetical protein